MEQEARNPQPTASPSRLYTISRVKIGVAQFVRRTLHQRRPLHKRTSSTGKTGFVLPGDQLDDRLASRGTLIPRPHNSTRKVTLHTNTSRASILSIRSIGQFGETPHIFVTQPSDKGRHRRMVHRGSSASDLVDLTAGGKKCLRYSHPTATAVIPTLSTDHLHSSVESLAWFASDCGSMVSTPKTADMDRDFPGTVNVRKIARESAFAFEDAKAVVDGIKQRCDTSQRNSAALPTIELTPFRPLGLGSAATDVEKHRETALAALSGSENSYCLPNTLLPDPPCMAPVSDLCTATDETTTTLHDRSSCRDTGSDHSRLAVRDSLQFIPYSRFIDRKLTNAGRDRLSSASASDVNSPEWIRHRQVYSSVENMDDAFPTFDSSLSEAILTAAKRRSKAKNVRVGDKQLPPLPKMNDNGFPIMTTPLKPHSAIPKYEKRTLTDDELKTMRKEEKRRSRLADSEKKKKNREHNTDEKVEKPAAKSDVSIMKRMRNSLAIYSG